MRIVYEEDGHPTELLTALERERAVADGRLTVTTPVTVYRAAAAPVMMGAADVEELRPLFGLSTGVAAAPASMPTGSTPPAPRSAAAPTEAPAPRNHADQSLTVMPGQAVIARPLPSAASATSDGSMTVRPADQFESEPEQVHGDGSFWGEEAVDRFETDEVAHYRPDRRPMLAVLILIAVALVFAVMISRSSDSGRSAFESRRIAKTTNVRSGPGTDAAVVGRLEAGDLVEGAPVEAEGATEWFRIGSGPLEGRFVWIRNTTPLDAKTAAAPKATMSRVRLQTQPPARGRGAGHWRPRGGATSGRA
jgi:hypothetical protein